MNKQLRPTEKLISLTLRLRNGQDLPELIAAVGGGKKYVAEQLRVLCVAGIVERRGDRYFLIEVNG